MVQYSSKLLVNQCRDAMLASESVRDVVKSGSYMRRMVRDRLLIVFLLVFSSCFTTIAQTRPCDSLFVWVSFTEDKILIDIPESYITYRSLPTSLPKHVKLREVNIFVPELPDKSTLLSLLKSELLADIEPNTKDNQLKYLGKLVLLLYYSNNDLSNFPDKILIQLNRLTEIPQVNKEAVLVNKWVQIIKN